MHIFLILQANVKINLLEDERKALEEKLEEEARKIHNLHGKDLSFKATQCDFT